jgi:hypothetical protein
LAGGARDRLRQVVPGQGPDPEALRPEVPVEGADAAGGGTEALGELRHGEKVVVRRVARRGHGFGQGLQSGGVTGPEIEIEVHR